METNNLGSVKTIFSQATSPANTDVIWYDTINKVFKYFNSNTLIWEVLIYSQISGILTADTPTETEINSVVGLTPSIAGAGFKISILNLTDNFIYFIESNGIYWFYTKLGKIGTGALVDLDGNIYHTVTIGSQIWLIENLRTTKYADGSSIPYLPSTEWSSDIVGAYCWSNNNISYNWCGALYNWYAVTNAKNLASLSKDGVIQTGWRVSTQADWNTLIAFLGGVSVAGGKMKDTKNWYIPNRDATNSSGMTIMAIPGRGITGSYWSGSYWSNHWVTDKNFIRCHYDSGEVYIYSGIGGEKYGLNVRLVKDVV